MSRDLLRPAAVLTLIAGGLRPDRASILLLQRAATLRHHPGQVAFPGGRTDGNETPTEAALREAAEETGLDPAVVDVIAESPALPMPVSGHLVTPVLARCARPLPIRAVDPAETEAVFWLPVRDLVDPANRFTSVFAHGGEVSRGPAWLVAAEGRERLIWGFTARLLDDLLERFGWTASWDHSRELPL
ncbi:MAG: CoA pyrophosphatase [Promicromonosporaceae bacterium]|nr:CoA pyrophosphatase [Promicromonosporaceae bacterium]